MVTAIMTYIYDIASPLIVYHDIGVSVLIVIGSYMSDAITPLSDKKKRKLII